jgi:hypothetical protein
MADETNLSDIHLQRPDGSVARFGDVIEVPTVVVLARYYG